MAHPNEEMLREIYAAFTQGDLERIVEAVNTLARAGG